MIEQLEVTLEDILAAAREAAESGRAYDAPAADDSFIFDLIGG